MKKQIREEYIKKRNKLTTLEVEELSKQIVNKIKGLKEYRNAKIVGIYSPINNEVNVMDLFSDGKVFCFPKVINKKKAEMAFYKVDNINDLKKGYFNILEPEGKYIEKGKIDLLIIPLVAYQKLMRIGYGKGFYDNYLSNYNGVKIGVAYKIQKTNDVLFNNHDIPLDMIITED